MKRLLFILVLVFYNPIISNAQIHFTFSGYGLVESYSGINSIAEKYNYPNLTPILIKYKTGVFYKKEKFSIGAYYMYLSTSDINDFGLEPVEFKPKTTKLRGYGLSANIQYNIISKKYLTLFPMIEIGIKTSSISLIETKYEVSVEEVLNRYVHNHQFTNKGVFMDLGIGFINFFNLKYFELGFGCTGGYSYDFGRWKYSDVSDVSNEIADLKGLFITADLHFRFSKKR